MWNLAFIAALLLLFIFLFFRQDKLDHKAALKRDREGDLHMLREMKKYFDANGKDSTFLDESIAELMRD